MTPEELRAARIAEAWRRSDGSVADTLEILADLYETNWTPPEPEVDPDILAAREWIKIDIYGASNESVDAGTWDSHPATRAYLAGCTRGREGAKGLVEALEDMCALVKQNTYPQPDKPDTPWGRLQRALAILAAAKGERV